MVVIRKILMGIVWFFAIYFGACFTLGAAAGAIAGAIAGANDPRHAAEAGRLAGQQVVSTYVVFILGGSLLAAVAGAISGFLPGTKGKSREAGSTRPALPPESPGRR
jgi:hypothetical protein